MGNTVGSPSVGFFNFPSTPEDHYILGLWCADGYHWSSSIGLCVVDSELTARFEQFLQKLFDRERIKLHLYVTGKRTRPAYKLYVNCRPLLRIFKKFKEDQQRSISGDQNLRAYFAGRFDGDGCIAKNLKRDCRISYGNKQDAFLDMNLLNKLGLNMTRLYWYQTSSTYVLYVSRFETKEFVDLITGYSSKLQKLTLGPRRDLDRQMAIQTKNISFS